LHSNKKMRRWGEGERSSTDRHYIGKKVSIFAGQKKRPRHHEAGIWHCSLINIETLFLFFVFFCWVLCVGLLFCFFFFFGLVLGWFFFFGVTKPPPPPPPQQTSTRCGLVVVGGGLRASTGQTPWNQARSHAGVRIGAQTGGRRNIQLGALNKCP